MSSPKGVNLRVTGHCRQGGRKYMEDFFSVAYQQTEDKRDLEYAFCGIYDGHGGAEAAAFAKEHLMETIIKLKHFWSDNDEEVLQAIKDGYIQTHHAMWKEQEKWPRTASGLPSTAGTTASVAFIRKGKIYIGHVGDSGIVLGYQDPETDEWKSQPLTRDHKPENADEMNRIEQCGGKVVSKSGVPRVVWNRPRIGHQGPVRRSTPIDEIPFLAVARSLGDLWSYNSRINQFVVSPDPDCSVVPIDTNVHRCLIFGTDGLFNMLSPHTAVQIVHQAEKHNESAALGDTVNKTWLNPSKLLVEKALERWYHTKMRADNTSVVTVMLDPPGPPRAQVLKDRKKNQYPDSGLKIMTRYENAQQEGEGSCATCSKHQDPQQANVAVAAERPREKSPDKTEKSPKSDKTPKSSKEPDPVTSLPDTSDEVTSNSHPLKERNYCPAKPRESLAFDPKKPPADKENEEKPNLDDSIQINEISSSSNDLDDDGSTKTPKHNLRSTNRPKKEDDKVTSSPDAIERFNKRKRSDKSCSPVRKSVRCESQKKKPEAPPSQIPKSTTRHKLGIAQKILKSKKLNLKKKNLVKKPLDKTKVKLVVSPQGIATTKGNKKLLNAIQNIRSHRTKRKTELETKDQSGQSAEATSAASNKKKEKKAEKTPEANNTVTSKETPRKSVADATKKGSFKSPGFKPKVKQAAKGKSKSSIVSSSTKILRRSLQAQTSRLRKRITQK